MASLKCTVALLLLLLFILTAVCHRLNALTVTGVSDWLTAHELSNYTPLFVQHHIDGPALAALTPDALKQFGLPLGVRKKILRAIEHAQQQDNAPSAAVPLYNDTITHNAASAQYAAPPTAFPSSQYNAGVGSDHPSSPYYNAHAASAGPFRRPNYFTADTLETDPLNWRTEPLGRYDTARCNIDRISVDDITAELFFQYYFIKRPLLLVPSERSKQKTAKLREQWSKQHMRAQHGHVNVVLGTPQQLTQFGDGRLGMSLLEYISDMANETGISHSQTHYLFDRNKFFPQAPQMYQQYSRHPLFSAEGIHSAGGQQVKYDKPTTFALGPTGECKATHDR